MGDVWASHAGTLGEKQIALALLFTGSLGLPALWWETCRRYVVWHGLARPWMRSPLARFPLWFGGAAWLLMITNPWHGQFIGPVVGGRNLYPWGVTLTAYTQWGIALCTCALCAWAAYRHEAPRARRRMAILAGATLAPVIANFLHLALPGMPPEDTVALGLGLTSLVVIYGVARRQLFNLVPVGLHQILRSDPSGVLLLDRGGRLLLWNPAAEKLLEGFALEPDLAVLPLLASRLEDARTGEPLEDAFVLTSLLSTTGATSQSLTLGYRGGGGGERWLRFRATPIPGRRRRIAAVYLRIEEATLEERAARVRRSRDDRLRDAETATTVQLLADSVAHDFNNILLTIDGRARLALDDATVGLPVQRHLAAIVKASALAKDLTQQLRTLAGHSATPRRAVDLSRLVDEMHDLLADSLPPGAVLRTRLARRLPVVEADATQLCQVALNLVKNAGEAISDRGGQVFVETRRVQVDLAAESSGEGSAIMPPHARPDPGSYVRLEVSDDGPGLDPDECAHVFDRSFSTRASGRGVGLAIVRQVVENHGGTVTVESRIGSGTRFRVWIPVQPR